MPHSLSVILTDFRALFKYQNFHLFCVFVVGLIGGDADRHLSSSSSENGLPLAGSSFPVANTPMRWLTIVVTGVFRQLGRPYTMRHER